jgi:hypothetical protein
MDWADFQVAEPSGTTTVYLFLLVLGFCRAMYAELVPSCTLRYFMDVLLPHPHRKIKNPLKQKT